jgi:hypothetical protein
MAMPGHFKVHAICLIGEGGGGGREEKEEWNKERRTRHSLCDCIAPNCM